MSPWKQELAHIPTFSTQKQFTKYIALQVIIIFCILKGINLKLTFKYSISTSVCSSSKLITELEELTRPSKLCALFSYRSGKFENFCGCDVPRGGRQSGVRVERR
jgi:hypothetical protein